MGGRTKQLVRRTCFDDAPEVHHGDAVGDLTHHPQIMTDEEIAEPQPVLQIHEQIDHLRLDGDVQRRDGLITHKQTWLHDEGARKDHALALTAR